MKICAMNEDTDERCPCLYCVSDLYDLRWRCTQEFAVSAEPLTFVSYNDDNLGVVSYDCLYNKITINGTGPFVQQVYDIESGELKVTPKDE